MAGAAEAQIEHLHFGKLVTADGRVPSSEGFAVTRRSRNLDTRDDVLLSLSTLLDVRPFEPDLIDAAAPHGIMVVRWLDAVNDRPPRVAFVRARFRSEAGEGDPGRRYQQAAIWIASPRDWIQYPLQLLRQAAHIQAEPDRVAESRDKRIGTEPLQVDLSYGGLGRARTVGELSGAALRICDFVVRATRRDAREPPLLFGGNDFESEMEFLEETGLALQCLREEFDGRPQVVISSGFKHVLGKASIRYLKSVASDNGEFDENAARKRLEPFSRLQQTKAVSSKPSRVPAVMAPQVDMLAPRFQHHYVRYRDKPSADTAIPFINVADELGRWLWSERESSVAEEALRNRFSALRNRFSEEEQQAFSSTVLYWYSLNELPLGILLDLADLCARALADRSTRTWIDPKLYDRAKLIVDATDERLAGYGIWLPAELDKLASGFFVRLLRGPATKAKCSEVYERSRCLDRFVRGGVGLGTLNRSATEDALLNLRGRLSSARAASSKQAKPLPPDYEGTNGIHGIYPVWLDSIVTPEVYVRSVEEVLAQVIMASPFMRR